MRDRQAGPGTPEASVVQAPAPGTVWVDAGVLDSLGLSVGDTRVTDYASNPNYAFPGGRFIGDYFSLTATDDDVQQMRKRWHETSRRQETARSGE